MTFWNSQFVQAGRRQHRCESCGRGIPVGAASRREAGTVDGDFYSYRLCIPCFDFIQRQFESGELARGESFMLDWLPDIARDAGEPWPPAVAESETPNPHPDHTND